MGINTSKQIEELKTKDGKRAKSIEKLYDNLISSQQSLDDSEMYSLEDISFDSDENLRNGKLEIQKQMMIKFFNESSNFAIHLYDHIQNYSKTGLVDKENFCQICN